MNRILTGIAGLDQALHGGLPEFSTVLIVGAPGSGKTILTQNILFNNVSYGKSLYLTTLSEPTIKVIRFQQEFAFFDSNAFMDSIVFHELSADVAVGSFSAVLDRIDRLVSEHQPRLVAIDSTKAFADSVADNNDLRKAIVDLNLRLSLWGCTVLLVGEYTMEEVEHRPEAAIADGIISLYGNEERQHQKRYLRILKMRGTRVSHGEHLYTIDVDGVRVFPRKNPVVARQTYTTKFSTKQPMGVVGLDAMMSGGIPTGTTTLITGSSGTGKTLLSLCWLLQGVRNGEPGLFVTFEENPHQLVAATEPFGWSLDDWVERGLLQILHVSPMEVDVDELVYQMNTTIERRSVQRTVIDSITSLGVGMRDRFKFTDFVWSTGDWLKTRDVSLLLVHESSELFSLEQVTQYGISYVADNVLFLRHVCSGDCLRTLIGILKMRGTAHDRTLREFAITPQGLQVLDPIDTSLLATYHNQYRL